MIQRMMQLVAMLAALVGVPATANTIVMRSSVALPAPRAVTLADVAELRGAVAEGAAGIVVEHDPVAAARGQAWAPVSVAQVEKALKDAGVPVGRLAISGGTCFVRFGKVVQSATQRAEAARPVERTAETVDLAGPSTIKTRVAIELARLLGVRNADLRVKFDDRDAEFLATPADGRRIAVETSTSGGSARAVVLVRVYEGERLFEARTISADVEMRKSVVVVAQSVRRGAEIRAEHLREEERWISPGGSPPVASIGDAEGTEARTRLSPGDVLRSGDLEQALVVQRGETVDVLCLVGALEIKSRARAMSDGRVGDRIELRTEGSKRTFMARVDGPGRVVMVLDGGESAPAAAARDTEDRR